MPYEKVCQEAQLSELVGTEVEITFSRRDAGQINYMSQPKFNYVRTTVGIKIQTPPEFPEDSVGTFAIRNCLEILNRVIGSYQATTGEVSNAGFIQPLGTSDMHLFANIHLDGKDARDRWPGHSTKTFPLSPDEVKAFTRYFSGQERLPIVALFLTNASLSLEQGQYSLSVVQSATAVELKITQIVSQKLYGTGWSEQAVNPYQRMTLGQKLQIAKTDPRSLETYFSAVHEFPAIYLEVRDDLTPLRNKVVHRGYQASLEEARRAVRMARKFVRIVS